MTITFRLNSIANGLLLPLLLSVSAFADQCPTPTSSIEPEVNVTVSNDVKTGLYTYIYRVSNGLSAKLPIIRYVIYLKKFPRLSGSPSDWESGLYDENQPNCRVSWSPRVRKKGESGPVFPGVIYPGKFKTGFRIVSDQPPGPVKYLVDGKLEFVPTSTVTSAEIDEPTPNCPGFNFDEDTPVNDDKITGTTIGPSIKEVIPARIVLLGTLGQDAVRRADGKKLKDLKPVKVILFGSETLDLSKVDIASIRFGSGLAKVTSSKLLPPSAAEKKMELEFDPNDLKMRCYLDRAVFLTGKAGGKDFVGAAEIKKIDCKEKP
jgi:hypothetical protein